MIGCAVVERLLAGGEDVVVLSRSDLVGSRFDTEGLRVRRKRFFRGKGVPQEVAIYSVRQR